TIAYRACKLSLKGKKSPVVDGLTGEQRLFMGWAQIWRSKERAEYVRSTLQTSGDLPGSLRANAAAANVDGFYEAFNVKPGDRLFRAPQARVRIWCRHVAGPAPRAPAAAQTARVART